MKDFINIDKKEYLALKRFYNKMVAEKKVKLSTVVYKGNEFVMGYLKYLLEFLGEKFNTKQ